MCDHHRTYDLMDDDWRGWQEPEAVRGWREFIPTGWIEWLHVAALIAVPLIAAWRL